MVARTVAAPPTPWSRNLAEPQIDDSAYVHSFSNLIGDVRVGANVIIAPGTSIRADEGTPFSIGAATEIQDGAVIHGLETGRVVGDDGQEYSVWIGQGSCIAHMALIHGPAYIGDRCFIGFRSTVFNSRIGEGCIVMMHALVQDVEIPPGKYVPSGSVITNQQQAERLPDVTERDRALANHVVEINAALRVDTPSIRQPLKSSINVPNEINYKNSVTDMSLSSEIVAQVRSLLSQGYTIGAEHADQRRFKTSSWLSCGSLNSNKAEQVLAQLEGFVREHPGEYVRLIGIDTKAKRRVLEMIIQRPGEVPAQSARTTVAASAKVGATVASSAGIGGDVASQVRSFLNQGYKIGVEYANQRRFKTGSWLTETSIEGKREAEAIRAIESVLAEHSGEYVRLLAIDPNAKRRVSEMIIQRPGEAASLSSNGSNKTYSSNGKSSLSAAIGRLSGEVISQIRSLLSQGHKIGSEHADARRFKTGSWQSCTPIDSNRESDVVAALEACLADHQGEYVRLLGIDTKAKRRVLETVIQRPGDSSSNGKSAAAASSSFNYSNNASKSSVAVSSSRLSSEAIAQIRSLLNQGHKIGSEHADARRFKTGSWQSCAPIESNRESDVVAALEACLADHQGEYVRLLGIDSKAKRRVLETVIQRP